MFEGLPPHPADSHPLDIEGESRVLRELTWAELVSRLAASRGIRGGFSQSYCDASFDAASARRMAAHYQGSAHQEGKEFLNPDDLAISEQAPDTGTYAPLEQHAPRGSE